MNGIAVCSNRGPVTFERATDGSIVPRPGLGGLVTVLSGALRGREATWVAAPMSAGDREMAARNGGRAHLDVAGSKVSLRFAEVDPPDLDRYYSGFANGVLWFLHHFLWDIPGTPSFGPAEREAWEAFGRVNAVLAATLAEEAPNGAAALPQDFHLSLLPPMLREARPDLAIASFWHIPFCQPDEYGILPDAWGRSLLEGMLGADLIGFQTRRWAANFLACCREVLGARVSRRTVRHGDRTIRIGIYPVGVDPAALEEEAHRPEVSAEAESIERFADGRVLVARIDRTEPSKNILRGLSAFEMMLERRADLRGRVAHLALLIPSRREVPGYEEYLSACCDRAERINARFATVDWQPVKLEIDDNFPRTVAAYRRYDVLVVNPVFDGMNLVAREGPVLNRRGGALVLSRNAGAAAEIGSAALLVNPFDVIETAAAIERGVERALAISPEDRRRDAARLRRLARGTPPGRWLDAQLRDLSRGA